MKLISRLQNEENGHKFKLAFVLSSCVEINGPHNGPFAGLGSIVLKIAQNKLGLLTYI
jgi:hypothetical protein